MKFNVIKSYAKINLSLGVTGRLNSKYHKIESLVSFLKLHDEVKIKKINKKKHKIQFFGKFSKGINKENTIYKLLKILDEKNLLNNEKYFIKIKKNIPQKSGLGGGSMNASALIRFFIYKKILNFSKKNLIKLSKKIGQDVQFGLDNKIKILHSNGNLESIAKKLGLFVIIAKPNFGCSTQLIYRGIKKFSQKKLKIKTKEYLSFVNILKLENDLEKVVFKNYPKLKIAKLFMQSLPNIRFARMTGSGSAMLGYFSSKNEAINAAKLFKKKYKNYWCITSKTI
jgi:4-diphosphocytidyl-2-C-methyl-D-erythritol kinase